MQRATSNLQIQFERAQRALSCDSDSSIGIHFRATLCDLHLNRPARAGTAAGEFAIHLRDGVARDVLHFAFSGRSMH
jgi:hypothetical protein